MRTKYFSELYCFRPDETIGTLVNQTGLLSVYFIDGRSYQLVCPDGFKPSGNGTQWSCTNGIWEKGADCVRKSHILLSEILLSVKNHFSF